jgi:type I restriction enzyme, S subunit
MKDTGYGLIADAWRLIPSSEFCLNIADGTHDSPKQTVSGKHLITSRHIKGRTVDFENAYLISQHDYDKINKRSKVDQWDVIISMIGEYCGFCFVERNSKIEYAVKNVGLFKTGDRIKAFWLYYFLNSEIGKFILETNKSGTSQPYLSLGILRNLPIVFPDNDREAKTIVELLSSLDDKIDLLHRQNKTLEAMAETLFRQWFVEPFDSAQGKDLDEGWKEGKLVDIMKLSNGKSRPNTVGLIPVYGGNGILDFTDQHNYEGESIIIGRVGAYCGSLYFENCKIWVSDNALHARAKNENENFFLFYYLKSIGLNSFAEGSSHPLLTQTLINSIDITIPSVGKRIEFNTFAKATNDKIMGNKLQIRILEKLRDTLLPKLMSGEVRVEL